VRTCTSNAIFANGYVHALRQHPMVSEVTNLAMGGSSSNAFAYWRQSVNFSRFDFCMLDDCVNDSTLFGSGLQSLQNVRACLVDAILTIEQSASIPLLSMLPLLYARNNAFLMFTTR
jgi:hypothetical protein